jgi:hypothetical protein
MDLGEQNRFITVADGPDGTRGLWSHADFHKDKGGPSESLHPYDYGTLDMLHHDAHGVGPATLSTAFFREPVVLDHQGPVKMVYISGRALEFFDLPEDNTHLGMGLHKVDLVLTEALLTEEPRRVSELPARAFLGSPEDIDEQVSLFAEMIDLRLSAAKMRYLFIPSHEAREALAIVTTLRHEIAIYQKCDIQTYTDTALLESKIQWILQKGTLRSISSVIHGERGESLMNMVAALENSDKAVRDEAISQVEQLGAQDQADIDVLLSLSRRHFYFKDNADSDDFKFPYEDFVAFLKAIDEYKIRMK